MPCPIQKHVVFPLEEEENDSYLKRGPLIAEVQISQSRITASCQSMNK